MDLDINIELLPELPDVLAALADEEVCELLRILEAHSVASLAFILLFLKNESKKLFGHVVDGR